MFNIVFKSGGTCPLERLEPMGGVMEPYGHRKVPVEEACGHIQQYLQETYPPEVPSSLKN